MRGINRSGPGLGHGWKGGEWEEGKEGSAIYGVKGGSTGVDPAEVFVLSCGLPPRVIDFRALCFSSSARGLSAGPLPAAASTE